MQPSFQRRSSQANARKQVGARRMIRSLAWMLPLATITGVSPARARSHSHHSQSNSQWAQEWHKKWIATHGGSASVATVKSTSAPADKTNAVGIVPAPAAPETTPVAATVKTVAPSTPAAPTPAAKPATAPPVASARPAPSAGSNVTHAAAPSASQTQPASKRPSPAPAPSLLAQTKPDVIAPTDGALGSTATGDHTRDNPMSSVGDSWKMVAYLVPVLLGMVGFLHLLKRFQARTGRMPGFLQNAAQTGGKTRKTNSGGVWNALVGSFHLNNARQAGGSSIRLLESVPIGGANVHLLEVRGRILLLGASGAGLNLLAEFEERGGASANDFRDLLHAAAADMDALDYEQDDLPTTAAVSTLEDLMRETNQNVAKNARRLRTVREVEIDE